MILTVSRMEEEKKSNPGYRAFFANGDNATRTLVLFVWEVFLEWTASLRAIRRDVRPRGHRGGIYPLMRAALCVFVRDLIVSGVLTDMMRGRPAVYATFSSYDEVAHHSGLERADTLEALRKLDDHFAHIEHARRYAPRPYEIVVLSDHGQTQGATFKQRNGYGLDELVERSLARGQVAGIAGGDEQSAMVGNAVSDATGKKAKKPKNDVSDRDVVVLGSGNLGLIYLMEERRRLTLEEIDERHPDLIPALRAHPHVGWLLVRSSARGAVALGGSGIHFLAEGRVEGEDPLAHFSPHRPAAPAADRRLRARRRHHGRELLRPRARRGLRVRGADLLPRRHRRAADASVHPPPDGARGPAGPDPRRRERARHPRGLATAAPGRVERRRGGLGRASRAGRSRLANGIRTTSSGSSPPRTRGATYASAVGELRARPQDQPLDVVRLPADRRARHERDVEAVRDLVARRGARLPLASDPGKRGSEECARIAHRARTTGLRRTSSARSTR